MVLSAVTLDRWHDAIPAAIAGLKGEIIGNAGTYGTTSNASDGVVSLTSGSLGFVEPDQRTRIVPYCHITPGFLTGLGMSCANNHGIADIDSASHLSAQIVRSFLADTTTLTGSGATLAAEVPL